MNVSVFSDEVNYTTNSSSSSSINPVIRGVIWDVIWYVAITLRIPGNTLSAIVWLRRHKNSPAVYLAALAINDLAYLLLELLLFFVFGCNFNTSWQRACIFYLSRIAACLEPQLVLGFSVERLIAILRPLQVRRRRLTSIWLSNITFLLSACSPFICGESKPVDGCGVLQLCH